MSGEVGLFVPCFVDQLWPRAAKAAVLLLEDLGYMVRPLDAACCGQSLENAGEREEASGLRKRWSKAASGFQAVLVLSASCAAYLRRTGTRRDPPIFEICEWLEPRCPKTFPNPVRRRLALHRSCASLRETGTARAVDGLLGRIEGLRLHRAGRDDECCGFGGTFAVQFPELSARMGRDKLRDLFDPGDRDPPVGVVSADCSCMLHLQSLADPFVPFHHVVEILWEAFR